MMHRLQSGGDVVKKSTHARGHVAGPGYEKVHWKGWGLGKLQQPNQPACL